MNTTIPTFALFELSKTLQYETSYGCAQNMFRASRYAQSCYPSLSFVIKMGYHRGYDGYIEDTCVDGVMCRQAAWLTAMFCANNMKRSIAAYSFLSQQFRDVPIEDLVDFFMLAEGWDAQILQVLIGIPVRQDFVTFVKSILNFVELKYPKVESRFYRQPRSSNYIVPLSSVRVIVNNLVNSEGFACNPMNEFVTRLDLYFLNLGNSIVQTATTVLDKNHEKVEDIDVFNSLKQTSLIGLSKIFEPLEVVEELSLSELAYILDSSKQSQDIDWSNEIDLAQRVHTELPLTITESLDLTIPLLLMGTLLFYLGWISPFGCG